MASAEKKSHKRKRVKWVLIFIVSLLIIVRIILPYVVLHYANKTLAAMNGYFGHINDIDLSIYRGAYIIKDFYIDKVDSSSQQRVPFISSQIIDLSVEWKSLFHGRVVGELEFKNPVLLFTKDKAEPGAIQKDTNDFRKVLKSFMPLKINRFEIINGKIQYIDATSTPKVNIAMTDAYMLAQNLSSVLDTALLPATVDANANVYKGTFNFKMKINPLADQPTYDLNAELKNTNLPDMNDFLKAYANFDVHAGTFGLYTEVAAKDGKYIGYVKPVIKNLKVLGPEDRHDSFFNKLYEVLVGTVGVILKNPKEKQVATKVPIKGEYGNSTVGTWYAIIDVLRNAFIQALYPSVDNEITIASVNKVEPEKKKTFLQKIFTKTDKNEKNKESSKKDKKK
ncbi:MAG: DUF748 domain-containing protein [Bacteroidia bacterium]